ncbi:MAG TPA: tripartite tricarboxylate transporter TctB family protein [Hyphomicrobiales bacterium]|nr:tripartite tricarboxylate transporter TctB family protein [Hyphomicrobiales bacterium]
MRGKACFSLLPPLFLALLGLAIALGGHRYGFGSLSNVGSGTVPVLLGILLMVLALAQLWGQRRQVSEVLPADFPWVPLLFSAGSLLLWAELVERVGFFPAAAAQLVLASCAVRQESWRGILVGIVLTSLATYVLFVWLLGMPVPAFGA